MADNKKVDEVKDEEIVVDGEVEQKDVETEVEETEVKTKKGSKKKQVEADSDNQEEVVNSKKKITSNKSMSKKKKGIIALTVTLCIVAIALSIVLPIVFYCRPRIFVKTADQFVAGNKVGEMNKFFYTLNKNVSCGNLTIEDEDVYSIDMNKHSLNVDGEFAIKTGKEGTLYIGTRKSDTQFTSKNASLKAKTIRIEASNLDVVIMADISCENLFVNAKSLQVGNFLSDEDEVKQINISIKYTDKVRFSGNIPGTATSIIDIYNSDLVTVDSGVSITNTISLTNSNLTVKSMATLATVELDSKSKAYVSGTITNSIVGGAQVTMQEGHSCNTYQDINTLVIYRDTQKSHLIKNCANVIYVEKLARPVDINIQEIDNRVYCKVASVKYASGYRLLINDEEVQILEGEYNTTFDITDFVKDIGTYKVSVVPIGNFNNNTDLTNVGHRTMYVDGDAAVENYNCVLTLQSPQNLRILDGYVLEFDKVLHADFYLVYVDGFMVIREDLTATKEDLSSYIKVIGDHSIRVRAFSLNDNIKPSQISMISYSATEELEPVDIAHLTATLNAEFTAINVTWQGTANGYEYIVYLQVDGDPNSRIEVGRTSVVDETGAIVYTINFEELPVEIEYDPDSNTYFEIYVVAAEHDYFTQSLESSCRARKPTVSTSSSVK